MSLKRTYLMIGMTIILLLTACSEGNQEASNGKEENNSIEMNHNDNSNGEDSEGNYHYEFGETFELIGYYSDEPMDVTVHDITIESQDGHEEYIDYIYGDLSTPENLALIEMTVINKGESDIQYADFIPYFSGMNTEIDITYPENETLTYEDDAFQEMLEPGEEIHFVGSVILTEPAVEYQSVLTFNGYDEKEGPYIYAVPQSEHKTPVGTYGLGDEVFPVDHGEDGGASITIHNIEVVDPKGDLKTEGINGEPLQYLAMDVTFKNTTSESIDYDQVVPFIRTGEIENILLDKGYTASWIESKEGEAFWSYDETIEAGHTLEATIFGGVEKGKDDEAIIFFNPYDMTNYENTAIIINQNE